MLCKNLCDLRKGSFIFLPVIHSSEICRQDVFHELFQQITKIPFSISKKTNEIKEKDVLR